MHDHVVTAAPVPFEADGRLDLEGYRELIESIAGDVDAVLVAGTTGEFPALDDDERLALVAETLGALGPDRTIAHVGAASTRQAVRLARGALELGARRLALLSPYYMAADRASVLRWFESFTAAVPEAPAFAYFFPERTGVALEPGMAAEVLALPGIAGLKLTGASNERFDEAVAAARDGQLVYTGDDARLPFAVEHGGAGVISAVSSVFPGRYARLSRALAEGAGPAPAQEDVLAAVAAVGPSLTRVKRALSIRTGRPWASRMALPAIDAEAEAAIRRELDRDTGGGS